jgi:hypothetical protein
MTRSEFSDYVPILQDESFALYPAPKSIFNRFTYVENSSTHVTIEGTSDRKQYELPLVLVEFANHGILRLTREVQPRNGSFI